MQLRGGEGRNVLAGKLGGNVIKRKGRVRAVLLVGGGRSRWCLQGGWGGKGMRLNKEVISQFG